MVGNVVISRVDSSSIMEASGFDVLNGFIVMACFIGWMLDQKIIL